MWAACASRLRRPLAIQPAAPSYYTTPPLYWRTASPKHLARLPNLRHWHSAHAFLSIRLAYLLPALGALPMPCWRGNINRRTQALDTYTRRTRRGGDALCRPTRCKNLLPYLRLLLRYRLPPLPRLRSAAPAHWHLRACERRAATVTGMVAAQPAYKQDLFCSVRSRRATGDIRRTPSPRWHALLFSRRDMLAPSCRATRFAHDSMGRTTTAL